MAEARKRGKQGSNVGRDDAAAMHGGMASHVRRQARETAAGMDGTTAVIVAGDHHEAPHPPIDNKNPRGYPSIDQSSLPYVSRSLRFDPVASSTGRRSPKGRPPTREQIEAAAEAGRSGRRARTAGDGPDGRGVGQQHTAAGSSGRSVTSHSRPRARKQGRQESSTASSSGAGSRLLQPVRQSSPSKGQGARMEAARRGVPFGRPAGGSATPRQDEIEAGMEAARADDGDLVPLSVDERGTGEQHSATGGHQGAHPGAVAQSLSSGSVGEGMVIGGGQTEGREQQPQ